MKKLSDVQISALRAVKTWGPIYMPYSDQDRTYASLARRELVEWRRVDDGHKKNGYALTSAGMDYLNGLEADASQATKDIQHD